MSALVRAWPIVDSRGMDAIAHMQRYKAADDFILENVDGEILLYHPTHETMVYCNATAACVWGLCDGTRTVGEITDLLAACYPDAAQDIVAQVHDTLDALCRRGLLHGVDAAPLKAAGARPDLPHASNEHRKPAAGG